MTNAQNPAQKFPQSKLYLGPAVAGQQTYYLRRTFHLSKSDIETANFQLSALGVFRAFVNGFRIGDDELAPGFTNAKKTVYFRNYDARKYLREGENVFGVIVAPGWYCGHVAWVPGDVYGDRPAIYAQLLVQDNPVWSSASPRQWKIGQGAYELADLLMGETVDFRKEPVGWLETKFNDSKWVTPTEILGPVPILAPHSPVKVTKLLDPRLISSSGDSRIFDVEQNFAGRVWIKVRGDAGALFTLTHGEMLTPDGHIYTANLRGAKATDTVILAGNQDGEFYEPAFTFHGFRYVEVKGPVEILDIGAHAFHTDVEFKGAFQCADSRLNKLMSNIEWSMRGNFVDVPTDCPQRDERLGWTGDAEVFMPTAMYLADVRTFFDKWFQDLEDAQMADGAVGKVAPWMPLDQENNGSNYEGGPAWADALPICMWHHWLRYGELDSMKKFFPGLDKFAQFLHNTSKDGTRCYPGYTGFSGFGDWLTPGSDTDRELLGTAYYAYSTGLTADLALAIGVSDEPFRTWHRDATTAFQKFWDGNPNPTQTASLVAIAFHLLNDQTRKEAQQSLIDSVTKNGLLTGFVGTHLLCRVLTEAGAHKLAYDVLLHPDDPGWLYSISEGATTMWERWDGWSPIKGFEDPGMNSFNHYAFGAIGEWMFGWMLGIRFDPSAPGAKKAIFQAFPDERVTWASGGSDGFLSQWRFYPAEGNVPKHWLWTVQAPEGISMQIIPYASDVQLKPVTSFATDGQPVMPGSDASPLPAGGAAMSGGRYSFLAVLS